MYQVWWAMERKALLKTQFCVVFRIIDKCSSTPFLELTPSRISFLCCTGQLPPSFSPGEISAHASSLGKLSKKSLILRFQHKPIQSYLSIQVYSDDQDWNFQLRRETTSEHKLADLPSAASCICRTFVACSAWFGLLQVWDIWCVASCVWFWTCHL